MHFKSKRNYGKLVQAKCFQLIYMTYQLNNVYHILGMSSAKACSGNIPDESEMQIMRWKNDKWCLAVTLYSIYYIHTISYSQVYSKDLQLQLCETFAYSEVSKFININKALANFAVILVVVIVVIIVVNTNVFRFWLAGGVVAVVDLMELELELGDITALYTEPTLTYRGNFGKFVCQTIFGWSPNLSIINNNNITTIALLTNCDIILYI